MVLHLLFGQQQVQDCLALLAPDDTLLVMDAELLEVTDALESLPCSVMLLDDSEPNTANNGPLTIIDTARWIELVSQHPHSMSWG
tara:strand:- start:495 stop:749 length:255 start_codon:yes stop_codon:yes gene_type:complete